MLAAGNIHYEVADRTRGLSCAGIGVIHQLARSVGLIDALDRGVELFKVHLPYHESDHVLNIAYNVLAGGTCLEDLELRRNDEVYLDALGARRIPDPTTAGDFCRRFETDRQVLALMEAINQSRLRVWKQQSPEFFRCATIDADGTIAPTFGECKRGMGMSYKGEWGFHPLLISLANTKEPLYLVNRPGNRPVRLSSRPKPATSRPTPTWTRPSSCAARAGSWRSCSAGTRTSRRPGSWTNGTVPATSDSSSGWTRCRISRPWPGHCPSPPGGACSARPDTR
jgi:hypothetical protein